MAPNPIQSVSNLSVPSRTLRQSKRSVPSLSQNESLNLLATVMEGLMDGVLIVTSQGKILQMNIQARDICRQLHALRHQDNVVPMHALPKDIWRVCEALIDSRDVFGEAIAPESELHVQSGKVYRIRVRWLRFEVDQQPCILVTLEDRQQSLENMAIADAQKYGLTERESEVWRLRLFGRSYSDIANELYIAENTVKKHIKSIFSKRRSVLDESD